MSTSPQYTLKSQDVYKFTLQTLAALPLDMPGVIHPQDLMRVLVFAAASRTSVHQACEQLERAPSGPTVLRTLAQQLSDLDELEAHVNAMLARLVPKGLGKRGCRIALDLTALPYHGTVDEAHQDEVCRSKAKSGTTHFSPMPLPMPSCEAGAIPWRCIGCGPSRAWITFCARCLSAG